MTTPKKYLIAAVVCLGFFALLGFPYINARLAYVLAPSEEIVTTEQSGEDVPAGPEFDAANVLRIPSLGIEAPIQYVDVKSEEVYQSALRNGVVHYPGTAKPGEFGNAYIFGHSSDYVWAAGDYKTVFALLPQIEHGAIVLVSSDLGELFTYQVIETKVVGPRDLSVLDQLNYKQKLLTLQTSYPLGTALQRFIVIAELVE